jgi:hypothetical protein
MFSQVIKPIFRINKRQKRRRQFKASPPIKAYQFIPPLVRSFVCAVIVETEKEYAVGGGCLTTIGLLTAAHNLEGNIKNIYADFCINEFVGFTVQLKEAICFKALDLAVFEAPQLTFPGFKPAKVIIDNINEIKKIISENKIYSFGCPQGIFGLTWEALPVYLDSQCLYTIGFGWFGVSGGPVFAVIDNEPIVLAINSELAFPTMTLLSRLINLKAS